MDSSEALTAEYLRLLDKLRPLIEKGLSQAVYTQITDVEIEVNGLLTYDRAVEKLDFEKSTLAHRDLLECAHAHPDRVHGLHARLDRAHGLHTRVRDHLTASEAELLEARQSRGQEPEPSVSDVTLAYVETPKPRAAAGDHLYGGVTDGLAASEVEVSQLVAVTSHRRHAAVSDEAALGGGEVTEPRAQPGQLQQLPGGTAWAHGACAATTSSLGAADGGAKKPRAPPQG